MIGFVCGIAGSGKTQRMVEMANAILDDSLGKILFLDEDNDRMFDLKHAIRLVNMAEYGLTNNEEFYGFVAGLVASDFDTHTVFIDSFLKFIQTPLEHLVPLFERLDKLGDRHQVKVVISISAEDDELPPYVAQHRLDEEA